jgi:hypothetical protein
VKIMLYLILDDSNFDVDAFIRIHGLLLKHAAKKRNTA